jgi:hypothetical protein
MVLGLVMSIKLRGRVEGLKMDLFLVLFPSVFHMITANLCSEN